jgi:hypothetical protein
MSTPYNRHRGVAKRYWQIPQDLRVLPDGSWRVGDFHVVHPPTLRYLKSHLVAEEDGPYVVDGPQRMPIVVDGPAFEVVTLRIDAGRAIAVLDDGSEEEIRDAALGMNADTGRFECTVRGDRFRAVFTRGAHQTLLNHADQDDIGFFLRAGPSRIPIRT